MAWQVYIILCSDASLYTGITNDLARRYCQHADRRGARYFRGRRPVQVVYLENGHSRSSASRREAAIKKLPRCDKLRLLNSPLNELACGDCGGPGCAPHALPGHP
jgi:putative endonuclease